MSQTPTQISLKLSTSNRDISNGAVSYGITTNGSSTFVSQGTSNLKNITTSVDISGIRVYGIVSILSESGNYIYGVSGNTIYKLNPITRDPFIIPGGSKNVITDYPNFVLQDTAIPASPSNNNNLFSEPLLLTGTNSITVTSTDPPYTVTTVFGTTTYLTTDGINIYALLPDSRIARITISTDAVPVITGMDFITSTLLLSGNTDTSAYGLAYIGNYLYAFDGFSNYLNQISLGGTILPVLSGNITNVAQTSEFIPYSVGSILTGYMYNGINYLFIGSNTNVSNNYYSIDVLQLSTTQFVNDGTDNFPPVFQYVKVFQFQETPLDIKIYNNSLYLLSYDTAVNGSKTYNAYQLLINVVLGSLICFLKGTYIYTNKGYELIENLKKGDLVNTFKDNYVPIDTIIEEEMYHDADKIRNKNQLYKLSYPEYPTLLKELYITGAHSILVGKLSDIQKEQVMKDYGKIFATDLFDRLPAYIDEKAKVYDVSGRYTIYHLALENENNFSNYGIFANGLLVESLSKNDCVNRVY